MDGGHLKTLRDLGMSLGSGNFGPTIHFAGFRDSRGTGSVVRLNQSEVVTESF